MSKVLVACDEHLLMKDNKYYARIYAHILIERYLKVFGLVRFAARVKPTDNIDLEKYKEITDKRIDIFPIPFFQGPIQYLKKKNAIRKQLKTITDSCHVAILRLPSPTAFNVLKQVQKEGIPYAVEVVANPWEIAKESKNILYKISFSIIHFQLKKACLNSYCASYVTKYALQRIYPTSDKCYFQTNYSSIQLNDSFFMSPRKSLRKNDIVTIAHVAHPISTTNKGHKIVIDIIKLLVDKGHNNVCVKFAGEGKYVEHFRNYAEIKGISDKIQFLGFLNEKELHNMLATSDIMVFPTRSEGLPRVLIEAMATGLPCISTPVGGIAELLPSEVLFNFEDVEGFTNKIIEIITIPFLYEQLSKTNFKTSLEYEASSLDQRRNELYRKLKELSN